MLVSDKFLLSFQAERRGCGGGIVPIPATSETFGAFGAQKRPPAYPQYNSTNGIQNEEEKESSKAVIVV
jgi:hypothetical protein